MKYRHVFASVLAFMLACTAGAQQKGPDFKFQVPLELDDIPGEVTTVIVWCDVTDGSYGLDGRWSGRGKDPVVIATTGYVAVPVLGHQVPSVPNARGEASKPAASKWPPNKLWDLDKIVYDGEGINRTGAAASAGSAPAICPKVTGDQTCRVRKGSDPPKTLAMQANATGAVDPALGTVYKCHLGFKAHAEIDGRMEDFDVFRPDDPKSYSLMRAVGEDSAPRNSKFKVLEVYGPIPSSKPKVLDPVYELTPSSKPAATKPLK